MKKKLNFPFISQNFKSKKLGKKFNKSFFKQVKYKL